LTLKPTLTPFKNQSGELPQAFGVTSPSSLTGNRLGVIPTMGLLDELFQWANGLSHANLTADNPAGANVCAVALSAVIGEIAKSVAGKTTAFSEVTRKTDDLILRSVSYGFYENIGPIHETK
jgi:hypothetical protein